MAPGARRLFGALMFEPEVFWKHSRKYLWHCETFGHPRSHWAPPYWFGSRGIMPPCPPRYAPAHARARWRALVLAPVCGRSTMKNESGKNYKRFTFFGIWYKLGKIKQIDDNDLLNLLDNGSAVKRLQLSRWSAPKHSTAHFWEKQVKMWIDVA